MIPASETHNEILTKAAIVNMSVTLRNATVNDAEIIRDLLEQMDYPLPVEAVTAKIEQIIPDPKEELIVAEFEGKVAGFLHMTYMLQLGLIEDVAFINYFCVDASVRSKGIGKLLEEAAVQLAKEQGCIRIELFSNIRRVDAHRFYDRQGYKEWTKYFHKDLK